jgi:hypothetical protein
MAVSAALLRRSVGTQRLSARRCVALCAVLLLTASLFSASAQALSISGFKNSLITFLLEKISVPGEFEVLADEVQSPSNGSSILKGVRISDARGVWFKAAQLSLGSDRFDQHRRRRLATLTTGRRSTRKTDSKHLSLGLAAQPYRCEYCQDCDHLDARVRANSCASHDL